MIMCGIFGTSSPSLAADKTVYEYSPNSIMGEPISLNQYKGKVLLIVNTASKCGFTGQYEGLEALFQKYKEQGFYVLGFPSNDFLNQEPGTNEQIKEFCKTKYKVSFPMFERGEVTGSNKQPLFKYLTEESGEDFTGGVKWNFEKFLIGRDGKVVKRFGSFSTPMGTKITTAVEEALNIKQEVTG